MVLTTAVIALAAAGGAQAGVTQPLIQLPAFTKGGNGLSPPPGYVEVDVNFAPAVFSPTSASDQVDYSWTDLTDGGTTGGGGSYYAPSADTVSSFAIFVKNGDGHQLRITLVACQASGCPATGEFVGTTIVDATPPVGTVQIDDGAAFTNTRNVTLDMVASDPAPGGVPGSASGLSQMAVDLQGDGIYPCAPSSPGSDQSGCAVPFARTLPVTLPAGDGVKTVGVTFGDAARPVIAPCRASLRCLPRVVGGGPIAAAAAGAQLLGNASTPATATIFLDTTPPIAVVRQDRFAVAPGGVVAFDASGSVDRNGAMGSGVDPASATWRFGDGSAPATGVQVAHAYPHPGVFVGSLTVADRAGNRSTPQWFSVTVSPNPAAVSASNAAAGGRTFRVDRVRVAARYRAGLLAGTVRITGIGTGASRLTGRFTPIGPGGRSGRVVGAIPAGPFSVTVRLPRDLLPGRYRLRLSALGTTRTVVVRIASPPQGLLSGATLTVTRQRAVARFTFLAQPARALRGHLAVAWTQSGRGVALVRVGAGRRVVVALARTRLSTGSLTATLRAGGTIIGRATAPIRSAR